MEAHGIEAGDDEVAPFLVRDAHVFVGGGTEFEGFESGDLAHDGSAEHAVLVDFHHGLPEGGGGAGVTEAPAGHGEGFGEAVEEDGALTHAGEFDDAFVGAAVVEEFAVNFVGEDEEVVFDSEGGDFFEFLRGHDATGGIGGEVENEDAGIGSDDFFDVLSQDGELIFLAGIDDDRHAVSHFDAGAVGDVAGFVIDDFIAGVEDGAEGDVEGFGDANGDEDLGFGVVADVEELIDVIGDGDTKAFESEIGGVAGLAAFERFDGGVTNGPGGRFVGLADAE